MHGEELVEDLRRDEVIVGHRELNAHQHRFNAPDDKKDQRVGDVHQPDLLVIDRREPLVDHIQRRPALLGRQRLVDCFHYGVDRHAALLSGKAVSEAV